MDNTYWIVWSDGRYYLEDQSFSEYITKEREGFLYIAFSAPSDMFSKEKIERLANQHKKNWEERNKE